MTWLKTHWPAFVVPLFCVLVVGGVAILKRIDYAHRLKVHREWVDRGCRVVEYGIPMSNGKSITLTDKWLCPDGIAYGREPLGIRKEDLKETYGR